jgi:hypothetical protein
MLNVASLPIRRQYRNLCVYLSQRSMIRGGSFRFVKCVLPFARTFASWLVYLHYNSHSSTRGASRNNESIRPRMKGQTTFHCRHGVARDTAKDACAGRFLCASRQRHDWIKDIDTSWLAHTTDTKHIQVRMTYSMECGQPSPRLIVMLDTMKRLDDGGQIFGTLIGWSLR